MKDIFIEIEKLIRYAINKGLICKQDKILVTNLLLEAIGMQDYKEFTKEEKIFLKGCFEKMGISSKDAQEWLNTFMIKKTPQSGKLGSWTYSKGNSKNQVISLINHNENNNYVNFYKKSKGNN